MSSLLYVAYGGVLIDVRCVLSGTYSSLSQSLTLSYTLIFHIAPFILRSYQAYTKHLNGQSDSDWGARTSFYLRMAVLLLPASSPAGVPRNRVSVTLFSCEAKIMAASEAAKEAEFRVYSSLQQQTD